jgi:hypothetical protein
MQQVQTAVVTYGQNYQILSKKYYASVSFSASHHNQHAQLYLDNVAWWSDQLIAQLVSTWVNQAFYLKTWIREYGRNG